jgi:hypothetical protein
MQALADKGKFDELYISTTQRAIEYYAEGKRRKFALKLHGDLAAFDLSVFRLFSLPCHSIQRQYPLSSRKIGTDHTIRLRNQFPTAHQTFSTLPAHYSSQKHKWPPLEAFMLARALDSHQKAGLVKDELWLEKALSFLGLCASGDGAADDGALGLDVLMALDGNEITGEEERRKEYLTGLVRDVRNVAEELDKGEFHRYHT